MVRGELRPAGAFEVLAWLMETAHATLAAGDDEFCVYFDASEVFAPTLIAAIEAAAIERLDK